MRRTEVEGRAAAAAISDSATFAGGEWAAARRPPAAVVARTRTLLDTVYSLSGEVTPVDAPADEAERSVLQRGTFVAGSIRDICFIRKIAAGGAVLHADMPLEEGRRLELELDTGEQLDGTIVWRRGCEVGLQFDEPIDVLSILARNLVSQPGERRRMPRVEVVCSGRLETGTKSLLVAVRDIAQGGARIEASVELAADQPVTLTPEGLRPLAATVRWAAGGAAGLAFRPELQWQELMPWLKARRQAPAAAFPAPAAARPALAPPPAPSHDAAAAAAAGGVQLNLPARVREGTRRWTIDVSSLSARNVEFECYAALRLGTLLWIVLPGLEGWPARIVAIDGYRFTCEFTQPLHPAVLERILATSKAAKPG